MILLALATMVAADEAIVTYFPDRAMHLVNRLEVGKDGKTSVRARERQGGVGAWLRVVCQGYLHEGDQGEDEGEVGLWDLRWRETAEQRNLGGDG